MTPSRAVTCTFATEQMLYDSFVDDTSAAYGFMRMSDLLLGQLHLHMGVPLEELVKRLALAVEETF